MSLFLTVQVEYYKFNLSPIQRCDCLGNPKFHNASYNLITKSVTM